MGLCDVIFDNYLAYRMNTRRFLAFLLITILGLAIYIRTDYPKFKAEFERSAALSTMDCEAQRLLLFI
jgi:hypothetical protein